jgi:hypothetical protein
MGNRRHYAFLDAWVLSRLADATFATGLSRLLRARGLVPVSTALSFVEVYNPGWAREPARERGEAVATFLADHPSVIVEPTDVFSIEYERFPDRPAELPVRLDLSAFERSTRREVLLQFLRRHETFLAMDKDVGSWAERYAEQKATWISSAKAVVEGVMRDNRIERQSDGSVRVGRGVRECALLSLDLRLVDGADADAYLARATHRRGTRIPVMRGCRTTSLAMWHLYAVEISTDRLAQRESDIGDILHLALAPYCELFTADAKMIRLLLRMAADIGLDSDKLLGPAALESLARRAPS